MKQRNIRFGSRSELAQLFSTKNTKNIVLKGKEREYKTNENPLKLSTYGDGVSLKSILDISYLYFGF